MQRSRQELVDVLRTSELLYSSEAVSDAFDTMTGRINESLGEVLGDSDLLLLPVLKGGMYPAVQVMARLTVPFTLDYLHASRYAGGLEGGELTWRAEPFTSLEGRTVLVVDDIFDYGQTLEAIVEYCRGAGAAAVYSATFVMKRRERYISEYRPDFIGVEIDDRYVFGCGMDYEEYFRGLPELRALSAD
ncbi:MAG: hypoxanthine-guanine phosphoribosyltransferase [Pseudomonadota bacterium]